MDLSFERTEKGNFLVAGLPESGQEGASPYIKEMLDNARIPLLMRRQDFQMDGCRKARYRINGMQSLAKCFEERQIDSGTLQFLLRQVTAVQRVLRRFLLPDRYLYLRPELVWLNRVEEKAGFFYLPEEETGFASELERLVKFLLMRLDHDDQEAVRIAYDLAASMGEEGFVLGEWFDKVSGEGKSGSEASAPPHDISRREEWKDRDGSERWNLEEKQRGPFPGREKQKKTSSGYEIRDKAWMGGSQSQKDLLQDVKSSTVIGGSEEEEEDVFAFLNEAGEEPGLGERIREYLQESRENWRLKKEEKEKEKEIKRLEKENRKREVHAGKREAHAGKREAHAGKREAHAGKRRSYGETAEYADGMEALPETGESRSIPNDAASGKVPANGTFGAASSKAFADRPFCSSAGSVNVVSGNLASRDKVPDKAVSERRGQGESMFFRREVSETGLEKIGMETVWLAGEKADGLAESREPLMCLLPVGACAGQSGEEIHLEKPFYLVGKAEGYVDILLDEESVSRIHAEIVCSENGVFLEDCNSRNGTSIDGKLLQPNERVRLEPGMRICFGDVQFLFR